MKINTVIFDIGGVLVDFGREHFFEQFGHEPEMCRLLYERTVRSPYWKEFDLGLLPDEKVIDLFAEYTPELEREIRESMANVNGVVRRMDAAIPWIKEIKASGRKALYLSNYSMKVARDNAEAMDFLPHLDGGLLSCDYHVIKPDPAFYKILIEKYDLDPSRCVFLDDLEENLATARELGIHTIQVRDHEQAAADLERLLYD